MRSITGKEITLDRLVEGRFYVFYLTSSNDDDITQWIARYMGVRNITILSSDSYSFLTLQFYRVLSPFTKISNVVKIEKDDKLVKIYFP
jgi:hypothetical protein